MKRTLLTLLLISLMLSLSACTRIYYTWNSVGPIQALANEDELWVFLEIDRQVNHTQSIPLLGYDAPSVYPVGHFQELFIFNQQGLKQRTTIELKNGKSGHSFHPNLSRIFLTDGDMYLFSGPSMNYTASLYKWEKDHFKILSVETSDNFYTKHKPSYFTGKRSEVLDPLTEAEGWSHLFSDTSFSGANFDWGKRSVAIEFIQETDTDFEVEISITENDTITSAHKLIYPKGHQTLNDAQYRALPEEDYGHAKE